MGILDGIVDWLATQVMNLLDLASTSVLGALGCNMDTFKRYFPAASAMYEIFIWTAIGLVLLNLVWQLYRCYGAGFDIDTENPINLVVRSVIFLLLIWYCDDIVNLALRIGGTPYNWILDSTLPGVQFGDFNSVLLVIIGVSRHVQQSTASSISGQSGGIGASLGGAMYHNSLGKEGGFASKVIGSIATGQIGGSITGDSAVEALNGYFTGTSDMNAMQIPATGENIPTAMATAESDAVTDSPIPATPLALEGDSTVDVSPTRDSEITIHAGGSPAVTEQTTIPTSSSIQQAAMNRVLLGQMGNSVTDVEIGGGKIQGREIIPGRGQIQFAMYNARQYEKPEGHFTEQTSRDGEKWYKVYATTRVEKTPTVQDERGRMQYDERKVAAMPKAPARRH